MVHLFQDSNGATQHLTVGRIQPRDPHCQPLVAPTTVRKQHMTAGVGQRDQALPMIADIIALIGSLDVVLGEIDR